MTAFRSQFGYYFEAAGFVIRLHLWHGRDCLPGHRPFLWSIGR